MERVTETLVQFAAGLRGDALPDSVVEQTRLFIADYLAAGLAGYRINRSFNAAARYMLDCEASGGASAVLLDRRRYPAADAAFLNAVYAHGADMDDGNRKAAGHIAAHVMSAVFSLADTLEVSWGEVFAAIHVGYEFFNRIAGAAMPGLYNKGFHSTGVAGAVACDAACMMHMGALTMMGKYTVPNFLHLALNNGVHESVGSQPSAGQKIDLTAIAAACGYTTVDALMEELQETD